MPAEFLGVLLVLLFLASPIIFLILWLRARRRYARVSKELEALKLRFAPVVDMDSEVEKLRAEKARIEEEITDLRASYAEKRVIYEKLIQEVAVYDEQIALAQLGVYSPHFDFTDSDQFKAQIEKVRAKQKAMVSGKTAIRAHTDWEVGGSKREGKKMTDRAVRLSLRAFNNECDAALSNARWNNVSTMEKRIQRAFDQINTLNETLRIEISRQYYELKLKELWLTHEYREKQKEERDHKTEMRRLEREEKKLLQEADAAEREETKFQKLLDQAKAEAGKAVDAKKYEAQIAQLSQELEEAQAKAARAKSMAEQTRAGHIYVISNVGSFGEGVFKIGMTRRLEPMDRVKELGDASVPFFFDTHAMIYCADAPGVEKKLHAAFDKYRVNRANGRKEFFRVPLTDIGAELRKIAPEADIITGIEAQEYHETLALIEAETAQRPESQSAFPSDL